MDQTTHRVHVSVYTKDGELEQNSVLIVSSDKNAEGVLLAIQQFLVKLSES